MRATFYDHHHSRSLDDDEHRNDVIWHGLTHKNRWCQLNPPTHPFSLIHALFGASHDKMEEEAPSKHAHTPFTEARFCETTTNHHITFRVTVTWLLSCFRRESTTSGVPCFKMNPHSYCIRTCAHAQNHPRVRCGSRERDADYHPRAERIDTMFLLRISPISESEKAHTHCSYPYCTRIRRPATSYTRKRGGSSPPSESIGRVSCTVQPAL